MPFNKDDLLKACATIRGSASDMTVGSILVVLIEEVARLNEARVRPDQVGVPSETGFVETVLQKVAKREAELRGSDPEAYKLWVKRVETVIEILVTE